MNKLNLSIDSPLSDIIEPTFLNHRTSERSEPLTDAALQQALARIQSAASPTFFSEYITKRSPARLQLPPTVMKHPTGPATLLYTEPDGLVTSVSSRHLQWKRLTCPSFIVKTPAGCHLCFSENEALKLWEETSACVLQAYVPPRGNELRRCRVHWSSEGSVKCLVYTQPLKTVLSSSVTHTLRKSLKRRFNYASRLLKTSFSPHLPHHSLLRHQGFAKTARERSSGVASKQFLASSASAVIAEESLPKQVEEQVQELVHFFNSNSKKRVTELVADFIRNREHQYVFVDCAPLLIAKKRPKLAALSGLEVPSGELEGGETTQELQQAVFQLTLRMSKLDMQQQALREHRTHLKLGQPLSFPKLKTPKIPCNLRDLNASDSVVEDSSSKLDLIQAKLRKLKRDAALKAHEEAVNSSKWEELVWNAVEKTQDFDSTLRIAVSSVNEPWSVDVLRSILATVDISTKQSKAFLRELQRGCTSNDRRVISSLINDLRAVPTT